MVRPPLHLLLRRPFNGPIEPLFRRSGDEPIRKASRLISLLQVPRQRLSGGSGVRTADDRAVRCGTLVLEVPHHQLVGSRDAIGEGRHPVGRRGVATATSESVRSSALPVRCGAPRRSVR